MKLNPMSAVVRRSIILAPTLKIALETFVNSAASEVGGGVYSIIYNGTQIRVCKRSHTTCASDGKIYTDLDFFIDLSIIVRQFAGEKWKPKRIALQFWPPAGGLVRGYFPNAHFVLDRTSSWIELPRRLLMLPRQATHGIEDFTLEDAVFVGMGAIERAGFVYALKQALRTYLPEGYPDIDRAAKDMHTSVRTLQRNLARAGLTYSKLVEYARFEVAAEMLKSPNLKIIDIAYALAYQDPSHFSRAFRRFAGQTPREFRAAQIDKPEPV